VARETPKLIQRFDTASTIGHSVNYFAESLMLEIEHSVTSPKQGGIKIIGRLFTCQALGATNEVRYHGYLTQRTQIARRGAL
jgi:hypothetical protein